jgi:hypothetical protein
MVNTLKKLLFPCVSISIVFALISCSSTRIDRDESTAPIANNEGYLAIVVDTLDNINNIEMRNTEDLSSFYIGSAEKGFTLIVLKVEEGEYCFKGFNVYNLTVDYTDSGFCTYAEAGTVNYFGEFQVRDPVSFQVQNYPRFVYFLKKEYPELCKKYINESCS